MFKAFALCDYRERGEREKQEEEKERKQLDSEGRKRESIPV